jgi:hypothetical protein
MAAALLLKWPGLLAGAILFRPLSPFQDDLPTRLNGAPTLITDGERDSRRSRVTVSGWPIVWHAQAQWFPIMSCRSVTSSRRWTWRSPGGG